MGRTESHIHQASNIVVAGSSYGADLDTVIRRMMRPVEVHAVSSSSAYILTGTATKCPLTSGTIDAGDYSASFSLYDSGSGNADSLRYVDNDGLGDLTFVATTNFNIKHNAADSTALEFRALCYVNNTLQNNGHIYGNTAIHNGAIVTIERTTPITLTSTDYLNYRVSYVNASSTSGRVEPFGFQINLREKR